MSKLNQSVEQAFGRVHNLRNHTRLVGRTAASALVLFAAQNVTLLRSTGGEAKATAKAQRFNIRAAYPNFKMLKNWYLEGTNDLQPGYNSADPNSSDRAVLSFRDMGKDKKGNRTVRQYTGDPLDPNNALNYDVLQWQPGPNGALVYKETHTGYGNHPNEQDYNPGFKFMPPTWEFGQKWDVQTTTNVTYKELDPATGRFVAACVGKVAYHSWVMGTTNLPQGGVGVRTHTNEKTTLTAVPGGPPSPACPDGRPAKSLWSEEYTVGNIPIEQNGKIIGLAPALEHSEGGDPRHLAEKFTDDGDIYNTVLDHWQELPNTSQAQG